MRVLLGLFEVAGYYRNLQSGFRELGVEADFIELSDYPYAVSNDEGAPPIVRATRRARNRRAAAGSRRSPLMALHLAWECVLRLVLFVWALARYDAFILAYGTSILRLPAFEYRMLRLLRRPLVCVFHGSDTRPPYMDGSIMASDRGLSADDCIAVAAANKRRARIAARFATWIVDNPAAGHFHERHCVSGWAIGIPIRAQERVGDTSAEPTRTGDRPLRVLHSPSHPEAKGSAQIVAAVDRLRARGRRIELVTLVGRPNAEVLAEIATCDFVIDQLYSDTPVAGFAAEAASFGRPAIVGGYAEEVFQRYIPREWCPPCLYCRPEALEQAIERMASDDAFRRELGRRAQDFVCRFWAQNRVAARYLTLIKDDVPPSWQFDPYEIEYVHGFGLPEGRVSSLVRAIVARGGREALQLSDKPELESKLLALAGAPAPPHH